MIVKTRSGAPLGKVSVGAFSGAIGAIIVWLLNRYLGADVPADIAVAISTAVAFVAAYLTPIAPGEVEQVRAAGELRVIPPEQVAQIAKIVRNSLATAPHMERPTD